MITARILWRAVPAWVKAALAGLLVIGATFYAGRYVERMDTRASAAEARAEHINDARGLENEIENRTDDDLRDDLGGVLGAAD